MRIDFHKLLPLYLCLFLALPAAAGESCGKNEACSEKKESFSVFSGREFNAVGVFEKIKENRNEERKNSGKTAIEPGQDAKKGKTKTENISKAVWASGILHLFSGIFMFLAAIFIFPGIKKKIKKADNLFSLSFILAGLAPLTAILIVSGKELFIGSSDIKAVFAPYFSFALMLSSAGMAELTRQVTKRKIFWKSLFHISLGFCVYLLFKAHSGMNPSAQKAVFLGHVPAAAGLIMFMAADIFNIGRKKRILNMAASLFLMFSGFSLLLYNEKPDAFTEGSSVSVAGIMPANR